MNIAASIGRRPHRPRGLPDLNWSGRGDHEPRLSAPVPMDRGRVVQRPSPRRGRGRPCETASPRWKPLLTLYILPSQAIQVGDR